MFTEREREIIEWGKNNGKTKQETFRALQKFRAKTAQDVTRQIPGLAAAEEVKNLDFKRGSTPQIAEGLKVAGGEALEDVKQEAAGLIQDFRQRGETAVEAVKAGRIGGEVTPLEGGAKAGMQVAGAFSDIVGRLFNTIGKLALTEENERAVKDKFVEVIQETNIDDAIAKWEEFEQENPRLADNLRTAGLGLEFVAEIAGAGAAKRIGVASLDQVDDAMKQLSKFEVPQVGNPASLFRSSPKNIDDAIKQSDVSSKRINQLIAEGKTAEARALAEQSAPEVSVIQKWAGINPDIKRRVQGKQELMREYFDVTHARNFNDELPTIQEYAGDYARKAADQMEDMLRETGGDIGAVRTKLGGIKANVSDIAKVENTFKDELTKLNLVIRNGQVVQKAGTPTKLQGTGDLKAINDLYREIRVLKQNPTLSNIIDVRTNFDGKINFGKSQREVSNSVDGLSRSVRSDLAKTANSIVGKTGAADVKKYSEFMEALNNLKAFTDRKAGGEYLLRNVLSGRGGEARQVIETIKETTGIDLMDHATMMQISLEVIANDAQKNLFRQEISKAGLDAARILGGDTTGAAAVLFERISEKIADPEKAFLAAAAEKPSNSTLRRLTRERGAVGEPTNAFMVKQINKELQSVSKKMTPIVKKIESGKATDRDYDRLMSLESDYDELLRNLKYYGGKPSKN